MTAPLDPDRPDDRGVEPAAAPTTTTGEPDLDAVERDLDDVERALGRLDEGTYWTDEVTGGQIPDDVLADNPAARRA